MKSSQKLSEICNGVSFVNAWKQNKERKLMNSLVKESKNAMKTAPMYQRYIVFCLPMSLSKFIVDVRCTVSCGWKITSTLNPVCTEKHNTIEKDASLSIFLSPSWLLFFLLVWLWVWSGRGEMWLAVWMGVKGLFSRFPCFSLLCEKWPQQNPKQRDKEYTILLIPIYLNWFNNLLSLLKVRSKSS